ncbi:hypothetical protein GOP47_0028691, partial [Adiantum capillus-veneris]
ENKLPRNSPLQNRASKSFVAGLPLPSSSTTTKVKKINMYPLFSKLSCLSRRPLQKPLLVCYREEHWLYHIPSMETPYKIPSAIHGEASSRIQEHNPSQLCSNITFAI